MVSSLVLDNGADANQYNPFRIDIKSPPEHKFGNWDGNKMAEVQISMSVNDPLTGNQQEKASAVLSIFFTSEPAKADAPNEDNSVLANAMDSASQLDLHGLINSGNIKKHSVYTEKFTDAGTECQGKTLSWILLNNNDGIQRASAE